MASPASGVASVGAHRHVVLTIPRQLHPLLRRRRELLTELGRSAAEATAERVRRGLGDEVRPGVVVSIAPLEQGAAAAIQQYRALKPAAPDEFDFSERELNRLGYWLLGRDRTAEAVTIFEPTPRRPRGW